MIGKSKDGDDESEDVNYADGDNGGGGDGREDSWKEGGNDCSDKPVTAFWNVGNVHSGLSYFGVLLFTCVQMLQWCPHCSAVL